ncbi:hypothetical protein HNP52_002789 [Sphingomonas kyeonggiensis]|uniref:Uncharacterized protein n=2 Tax=Sphingomonas kyeonggiensis TaxID=1268553 RepID=A0A7W7NRX3_9SPHN|nr:hypothetical protein [Sphingomonas kyeonggiensis]
MALGSGWRKAQKGRQADDALCNKRLYLNDFSLDRLTFLTPKWPNIPSACEFCRHNRSGVNGFSVNIQPESVAAKFLDVGLETRNNYQRAVYA